MKSSQEVQKVIFLVLWPSQSVASLSRNQRDAVTVALFKKWPPSVVAHIPDIILSPESKLHNEVARTTSREVSYFRYSHHWYWEMSNAFLYHNHPACSRKNRIYTHLILFLIASLTTFRTPARVPMTATLVTALSSGVWEIQVIISVLRNVSKPCMKRRRSC